MSRTPIHPGEHLREEFQALGMSLVDIDGKRRRLRSVPMPDRTKAQIDGWTAAPGTLSGRLFRAVTQGGEVEGDGITPQAVYLTVRGTQNNLDYPLLLTICAAPSPSLPTVAARLWNKSSFPSGMISF